MSRIGNWGFGAIASLVVAQACSGKSINELGSVNRAGAAGSAGSTAGDAGAGSTAGNGSAGAPGDAGNGAGGSVVVGGDAGMGSGGLVGSAGDTYYPGPIGDAGAAGAGDLECQSCQLVSSHPNVLGIAANEQKVFWIDFGTRDRLGNYEDNGQLFSRDLAGGSITTVATALPGPEKIGLSSSYVYLVVSERSEPGLPGGVLRIPLAGGSPETVTTMAVATSGRYPFVSIGGYELVNVSGAILRVDEVTHPPTVETVVAPQGIDRMFADSSTVYYQASGALWSKASPASTPVKIGTSTGEDRAEALSGAFLYGVEAADRAYLRRLPTSGGAWKRLAVASQFRCIAAAANDQYYFSYESDDWTYRIMQYSLLDASKREVLAEQRFYSPMFNSSTAFGISRVGVFFSNFEGLYFVPAPL